MLLNIISFIIICTSRGIGFFCRSRQFFKKARDFFTCSKTKYWYVRIVARNSYSPLVNRNSTRKRVSKMNPSVAGNADRTDATIVEPGLPARCSPLFVPSAEPILKYPSNQWKADRFFAWSASRGKNKHRYKIDSYRASSPVLLFLDALMAANQGRVGDN